MTASDKLIEEGLLPCLKYNESGLIPVITTDSDGGDVVMFAWMNAAALRHTLTTGEAHYWSRSRGCLWHKGAESGQVQRVVEIRVDCDQDCLWMRVDLGTKGAAGAACHTGRRSCFYRRVVLSEGGAMALEMHDNERLFDPETVYKQP